jgi:ketosteroid isomerase-like protein
MSKRHVETVRGIYERWAEGDFRAGTELFDPEITLVLRPEFPDPGTYRGPEGIRHYMLDHFLADFEEMRISGEELLDAGDSVVVRTRQSAVGPGSGAPVQMRYYHVWTFRGDRVIRLESIMGRDEALKAAGLPPGETE